MERKEGETQNDEWLTRRTAVPAICLTCQCQQRRNVATMLMPSLSMWMKSVYLASRLLEIIFYSFLGCALFCPRKILWCKFRQESTL